MVCNCGGREMPQMFRKMGSNRCGVLIILASVAVACLLLLIFSVAQAFAWDQGDRPKWDVVCEADIITYLSPFAFINKFGSNDINSCPWRVRNTAFRLTVVIWILLVGNAVTFVLFMPKYNRYWWLANWTHCFNAVIMFVVFVLDCDGINTGLNSCWSGFKTEVGNDSFTLISDVDECLLTPFVWTVMVDLFLVFALFAEFRICRYYDFGGDLQSPSSVKRRQSTFDEDFEKGVSKPDHQPVAVPPAVPTASAQEQDAFAGLQTSYDEQPQQTQATSSAPAAAPQTQTQTQPAAQPTATNQTYGDDAAYDNPFEDYV